MDLDKKEVEKPWVEKYRPKKLSEVAHQPDVTTALQRCIETGNLPHLLFYGPPGTGKTSTILACARELYGPLMRTRVLELNSSDERGIKVIRTKVKQFAQGAVGTKKVPGFKCPPYKIIILDECDSMTSAAQAALRRTMEKFSATTRFCLVCNYVTKIMPPVASRCAKFRFQSLPQEAMVGRLMSICKSENVNVNKDTCASLIKVSDGDMRKCINLLQSAKQLKNENDLITKEDILRVSVHVDEKVIDTIMEACQQPLFDAVIKCTENVILDGNPISLIFERLVRVIAQSDRISDYGKAQICLSIAKSDSALHDQGADEYLQLKKVLSII